MPQLPTVGGKGREIPVLDGVRALAALSVLFYHAYGMGGQTKAVFGQDVTPAWYFTQTGVHLFFVLSGFLLFLPFARAMLDARSLPATRRFYWRRALRILPTYWVCLAILAIIQWPQLASPSGIANVVTHIFLVHDDVAAFNRALEGPFWTLAVEAQFYVVLPLFAWLIARYVARTRSLKRLVLGTLGILVGALLLRGLDTLLERSFHGASGGLALVAHVFIQLTMGTQGKFLAVFAVGMLCAVLYIAATERHLFAWRDMRWIGAGALVLAVVGWIIIAPIVHDYHVEAPTLANILGTGGWRAFFSPLAVGVSYGALVLGALWTVGPVSAFFAWRPLRFIGLMSYSLYLWHAPFLFGIVPFVGALPVVVRIALAFVVAYASYRLLEVPFMRRRERARNADREAGASPANPPSEHESTREPEVALP